MDVLSLKFLTERESSPFCTPKAGTFVEPITVAVVEDESLFRHLLVATLSQTPDLRVVGSYGQSEVALANIPELKPDVVLLDIELNGGSLAGKPVSRNESAPMNGIELGFALRQQLPNVGIVLLSNHCEPEFLTAIPPEKVAGWSYLLKQSVEHVDTLLRTIRGTRDGLVVLDPQLIASVQEGRGGPEGLTPRQRQILELVASGLTNGAIARRLSLSEKTIQNQINLIYDKLNIDRGDDDIQPRVRAVLTFLRNP